MFSHKAVGSDCELIAVRQQLGKCPAFTKIRAHGLTASDRAAPMTAQVHETDDEYEARVRNLVRLVSACSLGLWSFAAGLLIGVFFLF
jgi:hypothetical protein